MIDIEDYIPEGYENRVTRGYLHEVSGLTDRKVRQEIARARSDRGVLIISADGGYFIPEKCDRVHVNMYCAQEWTRAKSQYENARQLRRMVREWSGLPANDKDFPGQMSFEW